MAQDSSGFPLGVFSHIKDDNPTSTSIQLMEDAGINLIVDGINDETDDIPFNLVGLRKSTPNERIFYYTKGYYTRWEAERDRYAFYETGFKHPHPNPWDYGPYLYGEKEFHNGAWCWATDSTSGVNRDSVLWGPNYRQDKNYTANFSNLKIQYTADYRMALSYDEEQYDEADTVCALFIIYRYKWEANGNSGYKQDTLSRSGLKVYDFPQGTFKTFSVLYQYPERFGNRKLGKVSEEMYSEEEDTIFADNINLTGIEFQLQWYGLGKLYIDYVDVYDNEVGTQFRDPTQFETTVKPNLITYAGSLASWNPEYWYVNDEPNTMDSYKPMRIVDSIITNYGSFKRPTITEIYPSWNGQMNGDQHLKKFVELAKPKQLMIDKFPYYEGYEPEDGLSNLREAFQSAHGAQAGFWYVAQAFSQTSGGEVCGWRRPDSLELNASVMLALAHGAKGIFFWHFSPNYSNVIAPECGSIVYFDGIVDNSLNPTDLYYYIKDGLSPR